MKFSNKDICNKAESSMYKIFKFCFLLKYSDKIAPFTTVLQGSNVWTHVIWS